MNDPFIYLYIGGLYILVAFVLGALFYLWRGYSYLDERITKLRQELERNVELDDSQEARINLQSED